MSATGRQENHDTIQTDLCLDNVDPDDQAKNPEELLRTLQAERLAEKQVIVLSIVDKLLDTPDDHTGLSAFVEALQKNLCASRVALSLFNIDTSPSLNLVAVTDQHLTPIEPDERQLILNAMRDCLKQETVVCFSGECTGPGVLDTNVALSERCKGASHAIVPLYNNTKEVGVLLLERHAAAGFEPASIELLEYVAVVAGPALSIRQQAGLGPMDHARMRWRNSLESRFGSSYLGMGLLFLLFFSTIVLVTTVPFSRSVSANAELVPQERRLVNAPFDGFIHDLKVQPGSEVEAGDLLARLEKRELELESARRDGDIAGAEADFRLAMASHDRQATAVARARLDRERALRALVDQRLERIELRAPIAGIVVSGDIADSVGGPVRRGETLFEIAQANDYEVHVMVHERDIREVHLGQAGTLSLRTRPREKLEIIVEAVHPVAEIVSGVNRFRIRATLKEPFGTTARPGESGVVKLNVDKTNLVERWGGPISQHLTELLWRYHK